MKVNVWDIVQWCHGRRMTHVPALRLASRELSFDHKDMADALLEQFFAKEREPIPLTFTDDPPTVPVRPFPPVTEDEIEHLLKATANKTAPGSSGIKWKMLKWAWPIIGATLTNIFDDCVHLGHHPTRWKEAVVVVIPTTQFGGRQHSSCLDAGLALFHDIQEVHRRGLKCAILLFDVKGFFDHVNHGRLVSIMCHLGFDRRVSAWLKSFLKD